LAHAGQITNSLIEGPRDGYFLGGPDNCHSPVLVGWTQFRQLRTAAASRVFSDLPPAEPRRSTGPYEDQGLPGIRHGDPGFDPVIAIAHRAIEVGSAGLAFLAYRLFAARSRQASVALSRDGALNLRRRRTRRSTARDQEERKARREYEKAFHLARHI
jgi:hypothetical protein